MKTLNYSNAARSAMAVSLISLLLPLVGSASDQPPPGDYATGAKVWVDNCGRCHNIRDARELRDDQWVTSIFHMRIRAGLTGQEARDTLAFLTASNMPHRESIFAKKVVSAGVVGQSDGETIYNQTCVACHGADGKGTLPGAPDFTSSEGPLAQNDDVLIENITYGFQGPGSPMAMPAKGGNTDLTDADIGVLLAYIREQFGR